jgi:hypothetical protein
MAQTAQLSMEWKAQDPLGWGAIYRKQNFKKWRFSGKPIKASKADSAARARIKKIVTRGLVQHLLNHGGQAVPPDIRM